MTAATAPGVARGRAREGAPRRKELSIFVDKSGDRSSKANGARHLLRHG